MDFVAHLVDAPLSNILIVSGIAFLGVAAIGKITGRIEPDAAGRILSGLLGAVLVVAGVFSHVHQDAPPDGAGNPSRDTPPLTSRTERNVSGKDQEPLGSAARDSSASTQPITGSPSGAAAESRAGDGAPGQVLSSEKSVCSPTFSGNEDDPGTRVLYFVSSDSLAGAAVYLNRRCQGYLGADGMLGDRRHPFLVVPPGTYEIALKRQGFEEFSEVMTIPPSDRPARLAGKVLVKARLIPSKQ